MNGPKYHARLKAHQAAGTMSELPNFHAKLKAHQAAGTMSELPKYHSRQTLRGHRRRRHGRKVVRL